MKNLDVRILMRPHIRRMVPYSTARDEYKGTQGIFLDANENPFGSPMAKDLHRYPDPSHKALKAVLADRLELPADMLFCGSGSDEVIDVLMKVFCTPGHSGVVILPPTYGMYEVLAEIYELNVIKVPLDNEFQPDVPGIIRQGTGARMLFLCSPNNPTGNLMDQQRVLEILQHFEGVVVMDEAYMDFAESTSWAQEVLHHPNLIVLKTLSKLWGLAALRVGIAIAHPEVIRAMNKVKLPYNLSTPVMEMAVKALKNHDYPLKIKESVRVNRQLLTSELIQLRMVKHIYPSDANFILVRFENAERVYRLLRDRHIIVRNRSNETNCENCLRITIGTAEEIRQLIQALKEIDTTTDP